MRFCFLSSLCEKHDEEGHQPLKTLGTLVQLYFHAKVVLDDHLQILLIRLHVKSLSLGSILIWIPDSADFFGESNTCGVQLITPAVELVPIALSACVARARLRGLAKIREVTRVEAKKLKEALIAVVVRLVVKTQLSSLCAR